MVLGFPEGADFRYGMEGRYGGAAISPGLVWLSVSRIRNDAIIPTAWNPALSLYKTFWISDHLGFVPNFTFMYLYGSGGMLASSGCGCESGITKARLDDLYFKEALGFRIGLKRIFFELNPGISNHYEYEVVEKGGEGLDTDMARKWVADGLLVSGSFGIRI